ncbi:hypothetical protein ACP3TC_04925 [Winslowiella sp. 2C04]|uniref:hypothetical protein n=1 Tax=Winslowiella sp. 2C04 TaxID=3416179 RepID=UPI003CEA0639
MIWLANNWRNLIWFALVLCVVQLAYIANHYRSEYSSQSAANQRLQSDNDRQAAVIATQLIQFNRFNQIAAQQQQYAVRVGGKAQEKEIEYRNIIKTEPTCALAVPVDIAGRLLDYANRLRASAMHANPDVTDSASDGTEAASSLTYCQAVLWIDPLLTAIDQANSQLAGIRNIEQTRQGK